MNHFAAYSLPVPGGFWAMCRYAHNAQPWPVMEGDKPKVFQTRTDAVIVAQSRVIAHINGTMRRDGDVIAARNAADALFDLPPTVKQRGKTKAVVVERKVSA